ncbi:Protein of unknown function [Cotesia congregata]|uniref:Uncharacterized protein n=1 Tax=Cotesia congregata TaxID=51543 RepID=A0A8J2MQT7_COTCN|nr:Protein of unknown function [Cotesia congregata]
MGRQVRADDVVRSTDTTEEIQVETSDISNKFKFFETYKEPEKERKQFRITPPRDGQVKKYYVVFCKISTGIRYGATNLSNVPAAPGTTDIHIGGSKRAGYSTAPNNTSKFHPYGR